MERQQRQRGVAGQRVRHPRDAGRGDYTVQEEGDQSGAVCGDEGGGEGAVDEFAGWEHVSLVFFNLWLERLCVFLRRVGFELCSYLMSLNY